MSEIQRKFDAISKKYDEQRKKFIPCFDDFYGVAVSVASVDAENPCILDIGAGTGLLSTFLMKRYPEASCRLLADNAEKRRDGAAQDDIRPWVVEDGRREDVEVKRKYRRPDRT